MATTNGPRMRRARTMARGRELWRKILAWLSQRQQRDRMAQAALRQEQPLAAIVADLFAQFGAALDDHATKLFVGTAIAGLMEEAGFDVLSTGDRMPASTVGPFRSAARYVRSAAQVAAEVGLCPEATAADADILTTMLAALDDEQRRRLAQMLA